MVEVKLNGWYYTATGNRVQVWEITQDDGCWCSDMKYHCASKLYHEPPVMVESSVKVDSFVSPASALSYLKLQYGTDPNASEAIEVLRKALTPSLLRCNWCGGKGEQPAASDTVFIKGMAVSVDVDGLYDSEGRRLFGTVTEVMYDDSSPRGVILLVQDGEPNWDSDSSAGELT